MKAVQLLTLTALVCSASSASSQAPSVPQPNSVFLEDMTWVEVRDAIKAGKTTVIIPTGGTEQNGPHMVLGKHNYLVKYKAGETAKRLGNALVAPVVAYVPKATSIHRRDTCGLPARLPRRRTCSRRCSSMRRAASSSTASPTSR